MPDFIEFEVNGHVATLTLAQPEAMNALSEGMMREIRIALKEVEASEQIRVLVLTGKGRAFCAGADLGDVGKDILAGAGTAAFLKKIDETLSQIRACQKPVIAGLNGLTLAGGLELALCADIIVAAEGAKVGDAHVNFGVIPGAGGAAILPKIVGSVTASHLLFSGIALSARKLECSGLLAEVWPDAEFSENLRNLAERIAQKSPLGLRVIKSLIANCADMPAAEALRHEIAANVEYSRSNDMKEGIRAFMEKRSPVFTGQ